MCARFNAEITDAMLEVACARVKERGARIAHIVRVPGAYDSPLGVQRLLERDDVDAVVALGAVVTGETAHDEVLVHATAKTLQELSLAYDKPVALGITGPRMTWEQAKARVDYAAAAVDAVLAMLAELPEPLDEE